MTKFYLNFHCCGSDAIYSSLPFYELYVLLLSCRDSDILRPSYCESDDSSLPCHESDFPKPLDHLSDGVPTYLAELQGTNYTLFLDLSYNGIGQPYITEDPRKLVFK
jgi:hypothetical protein